MATKYIEVDLDEFDNDELIDEIFDRNLAERVVARAGAEAREGRLMKPDETARDVAVDVQNHLCCHRTETARTRLRDLIACYVPPDIVAALERLEAGDVNAAICDLDSFLSPRYAKGKSASATSGLMTKREATA